MQRRNKALTSFRASFAKQKTAGVLSAIEGSSALLHALPRASVRQVSMDAFNHSKDLQAATKRVLLIGKLVAKSSVIQPKKPVRKVNRRDPWPKKYVRKIPLRTV